MPLVVVGVTNRHYDAATALDVPFPAGSKEGDFFVLSSIARYDSTSADARLTERVATNKVLGTYNGGRVWTGTVDAAMAPIRVDISRDAPYPYQSTVLAVFRGVTAVLDVQIVKGDRTIPSTSSRAAIVSGLSSYEVTDGWFTLPVGWTTAINPTTGKQHARIDYWEGAAAPSPATQYGVAGGWKQESAAVVVLGVQVAAIAAPLRLFPRRDNRAGPGIRNRRASPARVFPRQR